MTGVVKLLTNRGSASGVDIVGDFTTWFGGPGDFIVWGDFGGGTIELQLTPNDGGIVIPISGTQFTANGVARFSLNHGIKIRAVLTGTSSTSSGVFAEVF